MLGGFLGAGSLIGGIITIIIGIIILVWPRFLTTILGIWLIIVGAIAIFGSVLGR